jgi:DNA-binding GntR family transcriptional regulator
MDDRLEGAAGGKTSSRAAKPSTTDAEIRRRLTLAIADNRLPPGTKLGEENLAAFFRVSRSRIREILRDLARERLVTILPNRGAFVATPSVDETRQIYQARRVIEGAIIGPVIERITPAQLEELRAKVAEEEEAWTRDDRLQAIRCSREFHLRLAQFGGNQILSDTLETILSRGSLAAALYGERHNPGCMCHDHFVIVDALQSGNVAEAERLMSDHLKQVENRMRLEEDPEEVSIEDALRDTK